MADKSPTTTWMWAAGAGVNGVSIDAEKRRLRWYDDAVACACGDTSAEQTFEPFHLKGPANPTLPDDVLQELSAAISAIN
jgi:hypothetical protein